MYLLWIGARQAYSVVLHQWDPNYRMTVDAAYGGFNVVGQAVVAVLAIGAFVAMHARYRHALMMATAAMAFYTGVSAAGIVHTANNLPAAREAYRANREARGWQINERQLDQMFSPEVVPVLWGTLVVISVPPYIILLWRKDEFAPEDETEEDAAA